MFIFFASIATVATVAVYAGVYYIYQDMRSTYSQARKERVQAIFSR